jgi:hypothetical protein
MIDTEGKFIIYENETDAIAATAAGGTYAGHTYAYLTDAVTGKTGYFIETKDHDPNGQMGKYVITDYSVGDPEAVISSGPQERADSTNHHGHPSDECDYAIHSWKPGSELETREYVEWLLNTGAIITMTEWLDPAGLYKGGPVDKWIVEDRDDSGWVYWGRALATEDSTALFMEKVALIQQPEGSFYYVIHTDMEAVSLDELISGNVNWGDAGDNFMNNAPKKDDSGGGGGGGGIGGTGVAINESDLDMNVGDEHQVDFTVTPSDTTDKPVWSSSDESVATVDQNGKITAVGEGEATITVTVNGHQDSIHVTVSVDSTLPTKTEPGDGFSPIRTVGNPMEGDGLYVKKFYPDLTNPNNNDYYHDGSIHLEEIISDGIYTGVTVTAVDGKYSGYITIGNDHHGKPSILYSYVPENAEFRAWAEAHGMDDDIVIKTQVLLTRDDGKSATVTINMYYWDSSVTFV